MFYPFIISQLTLLDLYGPICFAPLQVHYYSEALQTTTLILCLS